MNQGTGRGFLFKVSRDPIIKLPSQMRTWDNYNELEVKSFFFVFQNAIISYANHL